PAGEGAAPGRVTWRPRSSMATSHRPALLAYPFAVAVTGIAFGLTWVLWSALHDDPLLLFFGAVVITAWYGGLGPSLVTTVLSVLLTDYYFIEPLYALSLRLHDLAELLIFVVLALMVNSIMTARRHAEEALRKSNEQLSHTAAEAQEARVA